jgi:hypothetical protein
LIKRSRLPVIQTVTDAFTFAFRKLPSLLALTLVASVLVEPLMFLILQVTGSAAEFSLFAQSGLSTDYTIASILRILLGILIILVAVLLFFALIAVPIIRHVTHDERLWLVRINTTTPGYMLAQLPVMLILAGIAFVAVTESAAVMLVLSPAIIVLGYVGVRLSLVPVDVVACGSLNYGKGLALSKYNGFRLLVIMLLTGLPVLIVGLISMEVVLGLYGTDHGSVPVVSEPDSSQFFHGGPRQILDLYIYTYSRPAFVAANGIVFLFIAFAGGIMLSAPAIAYRKLAKGIIHV